MVMIDDDDLRDRAVMLRRWGRRSELHFFGSKRREPRLLGGPRRHPLRQPVHLRRGGVELRAVGDGRRVRARAAGEARREPGAAAAQLRPLHRVLRAAPRSVLRCRGSSTELETAWLGYPLMIEPDAGFVRGRPPGVPRRPRHRHPHHLDRQRHPPADARGRRGAGTRRRPARSPTR